ncbi:hypothetical protein [Comamonas sp. NLF-1-9]|uniref:hypothetical protein n=1 Tax=Comamonas sp. NLF-1-9 TaxID=2853163 RepID=UPI001C455F09|nr:hypothetical protein [Comamonas sp. NLF-1-9]QXL84995.1 hypothetical protein KUD94_03130 [Comamonas sp. NLF-1-9]
MKAFTYSEARQNLAELLNLAKEAEVEIRRKDGSVFLLREKRRDTSSPFDVPGVKTLVATRDIVEAVRESRTL